MRAWFTKCVIAFAELLLIGAVAFGQTNPVSKESFNKIAAAALESDRKCPSLLMALGNKWPPAGYETGEYEIPPICWTDPIKELKPVKVYDHRLNVAIVLSLRAGAEEGMYIFNMLSSWGPIGENTDGFQFIRKPEERIVYFRRITHTDEKSK